MIVQTAILIRNENFKTAIRGMLITGKNTYITLERPWLQNQRNISCIPAGEYECLYFPKLGKFVDVYYIQKVPGRSGVLIHCGVVVEHSHGCILIGLQKGLVAGKPAIFNSFSARTQFVSDMEKKTFTLKIIGGQVC